VVERQLPKLDVAGSIPVSRSTFIGRSCLRFVKHHNPQANFGKGWLQLSCSHPSLPLAAQPFSFINSRFASASCSSFV
jgi:hypothetical protein